MLDFFGFWKNALFWFFWKKGGQKWREKKTWPIGQTPQKPVFLVFSNQKCHFWLATRFLRFYSRKRLEKLFFLKIDPRVQKWRFWKKVGKNTFFDILDGFCEFWRNLGFWGVPDFGGPGFWGPPKSGTPKIREIWHFWPLFWPIFGWLWCLIIGILAKNRGLKMGSKTAFSGVGGPRSTLFSGVGGPRSTLSWPPLTRTREVGPL